MGLHCGCSSEGPLRVLRFFGCQVRLAAKLGIFRQTLWHFRKKIFMADDHHQRLIVFRHVPNLDFMTIVSLHVKRILVSPLFHLQSPLFVIRIYYAFGHYLQGLPADICSFLFIILYLKIVKTSLIQLNSKKNYCRFYAHGFFLSMNNNNKKN